MSNPSENRPEAEWETFDIVGFAPFGGLAGDLILEAVSGDGSRLDLMIPSQHNYWFTSLFGLIEKGGSQIRAAGRRTRHYRPETPGGRCLPRDMLIADAFRAAA